ncbi:helix-turn-helix transcriptional regulator [Solwaraspora sp. WMMD937]|uniref:helix-turn-helix domain-containing protein n=1 Tax=Solwaraspora sp. WMMD937 TaxID=3016090 RepID=UPI00249B537A|nr:helix-turn-helix transcriptional regulator [Solwaraspora sp. WMMD937]WFE20763.1 helix-turn-helix transcriptional regulator [Solwaraspora sp. WMMD937]
MAGSDYLISELRRLRESFGLTQDAWADRIHFSAKHVGAIERGERPALPDYLKAVDKVFGTALVRFYREFVRGDWTPVWYRPFVEYEGRATLLRVYHPTLIPGLLQTEAYARALLPAMNVPAEDVEQTLAARLDRQEIITRTTSPCRLVVVVDEAALRRRVGDAEVMRDQLKWLVSISAEQHIRVLVVPADSPAYVGLRGPMVLASVEGRTVGFLEGHLEGNVVESPDSVASLEADWEDIRGYALSVEQSRKLIMEATERWT